MKVKNETGLYNRQTFLVKMLGNTSEFEYATFCIYVFQCYADKRNMVVHIFFFDFMYVVNISVIVILYY